MKLYKEGDVGTLVPQEERIARRGKGPSHYAVPAGHILCTIEELIDMWSAAERRDRWFFEMEEFKKQNMPEPPDLKTYLQSKGIQL